MARRPEEIRADIKAAKGLVRALEGELRQATEVNLWAAVVCPAESEAAVGRLSTEGEYTSCGVHLKADGETAAEVLCEEWHSTGGFNGCWNPIAIGQPREGDVLGDWVHFAVFDSEEAAAGWAQRTLAARARA